MLLHVSIELCFVVQFLMCGHLANEPDSMETRWIPGASTLDVFTLIVERRFVNPYEATWTRVARDVHETADDTLKQFAGRSRVGHLRHQRSEALRRLAVIGVGDHRIRTHHGGTIERKLRHPRGNDMTGRVDASSSHLLPLNSLVNRCEYASHVLKHVSLYSMSLPRTPRVVSLGGRHQERRE